MTGVNTFTYTIDGTPVSPATGTIVAESTAQSTRYIYDAASNLKSVTDGSSNLTKYAYDNLDRQSDTFWISGTNNTVSNLTRSGTTATVTSTSHGYSTGNVVEIRGATQAEYNGFFSVTVVDANTFTYIVSGSPATPASGTIIAEKANQNARDEFDANSQTITSIDRNGRGRFFVFDKLNRLLEEHWLAAAVAISSITFSGTTATVITSSGHGYTTGDKVGISGADQLPYNGLFSITVINSTTFTYTMAASPGTNATGASKLARKSTRQMSYAYDSAGRTASVTDPDSTYTYTYDTAGRLSTSDNNGTPNLPRVILTNFYNAAGQRIGQNSSVNGSPDFFTIFNHDNIGRINNINQTGTGVTEKRIDFSYNQSGQYSKISRSSTTGTITEVSHSDYTYDSAKHLISLVHRKPDNSALVSYSWTYDSRGRVSIFTNTEGTVTYSYDAASQVTVADYSTGTDENYTYDKIRKPHDRRLYHRQRQPPHLRRHLQLHLRRRRQPHSAHHDQRQHLHRLHL